MNITTIDTKEELAKHEREIETLFQECFGDRLSLDVWRWAYLQNPAGEPVVTLCHDEGRLVAHYAAIPMPMRGISGTVRSYLSMTTMVAESHRKHGLFVKLAEAAYAHARGMGTDFVMGFPNEMSTPGFRKRLNWNLPDPDVVATLTKQQLLDIVSQGGMQPDDRDSIDFADEAVRAWRLAKPGASYVWRDGLAYKTFGGGVDLMYYSDAAQLVHLPDGGSINVLLPASVRLPDGVERFAYQFGGISVGSAFEPDRIRRQMALSDVF